MAGFEQEALRSLRDSMHHQKSAMSHELDRSNRGGPLMLHHLLRHGTATPTMLAGALHASSGRVSALLGSLEKKGLITRRIDPKDRRNILVSLTDEGLKQARSERDEISSATCWVFSQMGERRTREFVDLVEEFMTYMSVCKPGEPRPSADEVRQAFEQREQARQREAEHDANQDEALADSVPQGDSGTDGAMDDAGAVDAASMR